MSYRLLVTEMGKCWVRSPDFKFTIVPTLTNVHTTGNCSASLTVQRTEVFLQAFPITCVMISGSQNYFKF